MPSVSFLRSGSSGIYVHRQLASPYPFSMLIATKKASDLPIGNRFCYYLLVKFCC